MLSSEDLQIIDFERAWWLYPGPKEQTMNDMLGLSPRHYYARLRELVDTVDAERYDPLTVRRLRRLLAEPA